jgi:RHS repeat-associated protein
MAVLLKHGGLTKASDFLHGSSMDYSETVSVASPDAVTSKRLACQEADTETGLYYYRARYYNPTVGRFLGEDPLGQRAPTFSLRSRIAPQISEIPQVFARLSFDSMMATAPTGIQYYYRAEPSAGSSGSSQSSGTSSGSGSSSGGPWGRACPYGLRIWTAHGRLGPARSIFRHFGG